MWISRGEAKVTKMQKRGNRVKCLVLGFPTGISMKISQIASASTSSTVAASHWSRNASCDIARPTQQSGGSSASASAGWSGGGAAYGAGDRDAGGGGDGSASKIGISMPHGI